MNETSLVGYNVMYNETADNDLSTSIVAALDQAFCRNFPRIFFISHKNIVEIWADKPIDIEISTMGFPERRPRFFSNSGMLFTVISDTFQW